MIFSTPEQALTFVSQHLQSITETLFEPDENACKYIAAWIVTKKGSRDSQTLRDTLKFFSREMDSGSEFVLLVDVLETDLFSLGEFYDDEEEEERYVVEFRKNLERLGYVEQKHY
jgi:hypothetical protein